MTLTEKAVCTAYTGFSFLQGEQLDTLYIYAERLTGTQIYTHYFASKKLWDVLHERSKPDFLKICADEPLGFSLEKEVQNDG